MAHRVLRKPPQNQKTEKEEMPFYQYIVFLRREDLGRIKRIQRQQKHK